MPDFTTEQARIIARIDRALKDAARAGLALRVFDGAVLMLDAEALNEPGYDSFGPEMSHWIDEHTERIGGDINADGGAGH